MCHSHFSVSFVKDWLNHRLNINTSVPEHRNRIRFKFSFYGSSSAWLAMTESCQKLYGSFVTLWAIKTFLFLTSINSDLYINVSARDTCLINPKTAYQKCVCCSCFSGYVMQKLENEANERGMFVWERWRKSGGWALFREREREMLYLCTSPWIKGELAHRAIHSC